MTADGAVDQALTGLLTGLLTGPADWAHAAGFVRAMFDPQDEVFAAGTTPEGARNPLLAADAGIWPYLAGLADARSAATAIRVLARNGGIGFSAASRGLWPEGTAFAALALRRQNDPRAAEFLATVARQISPMGYVYAAGAERLTTGFDVGPPAPGAAALKFEYFRRPALAPTAWAALAALGVDPLG